MSEQISAIDQDKLRQEELKNMEEEKKNDDYLSSSRTYETKFFHVRFIL